MALENPRTTSVRQRDKDPDTFIGISLPVKRGQQGWFASTTTIQEQTKSNLKNLLLTVKGERPFQPELWCELFNVLFEPMDDDLAAKIDSSIREAVELWLPHVNIKGIAVDLEPESNLVYVSLTFNTDIDPKATDSITLSLSTAGE